MKNPRTLSYDPGRHALRRLLVDEHIAEVRRQNAQRRQQKQPDLFLGAVRLPRTRAYTNRPARQFMAVQR